MRKGLGGASIRTISKRNKSLTNNTIAGAVGTNTLRRHQLLPAPTHCCARCHSPDARL